MFSSICLALQQPQRLVVAPKITDNCYSGLLHRVVKIFMRSSFDRLFRMTYNFYELIVKVKVSHSLIAVGAVGVRVPLYLGHS